MPFEPIPQARCMNRPLVSVVIATHQRHETLVDSVRSVVEQTYPNVEIIVVSDGPDPSLRETLPQIGKLRFVELGRNWHSYTDRPSYGAAARLVGTLCARGDYIAYLDDDDLFLSDHVESLVDLLEGEGVDFAYSKMANVQNGHKIAEIGDGLPRYGAIGTPMILHKAELLKIANWDYNHGYGEDYGLFQRWLDAGATYAFLDRVTVNIF